METREGVVLDEVATALALAELTDVDLGTLIESVSAGSLHQPGQCVLRHASLLLQAFNRLIFAPGHFLIVKVEDHDSRPDPRDGPHSGDLAPHSCLREGHIGLHDLQRSVLLEPLFDLVNHLGKSADEGRGGMPQLLLK
jgi:hypothetical protein